MRAIPKNAPVPNRNALLLRYFVNRCAAPSNTIGIANNKAHCHGAAPNATAIVTPKTYPAQIPVHRAQMGNCFPRQKNERSGILWHMNSIRRILSVFKSPRAFPA